MHYRQFKKPNKPFLFLILLFLLLMSISVTQAEEYNFVTKWGSFGSDQLGSTNGVAIDSSDNVYVVDVLNHRIQKFDSNGTFITRWGSYGSGEGQFHQPEGVSVDSSGNVYVADTWNQRIQKFDSNGNFITEWGSPGSGDGQFSYPFGLVIDSSGNVYVADGTNCRIQKFDGNGSFITKWGSEGSSDGQFSYRYDVSVDSSGNVYVADTWNQRIQKFDSNGNFITKWGSYGSEDGQFWDTYGVAVGPSGNVYVADWGINRIQKFDSNGNFITKWGSYGSGNGQFSSPNDVAVDSSGNVYITDQFNRIQKFDSSGNFITKWSIAGSIDGQFNSPEGVVTDSSGNVYVADSRNNRIQKFDSNGNFIVKWGSSGSGDGQFNYPRGLAIDSSGNNYVADTWNNRIQKFDSNGNYTTQWGSYGSGEGQLYYPNDVAVDSSGNIYIADTDNHRIQKFDSNGNYTTQWGSYGSGDGQFNYPNGVSVDSSGTVYVDDSNNNRIQKFDSNGNYMTQFGSFGSGDGQFNHPSGVAVDSSGNVYVADTQNCRIQKFSTELEPPGEPHANFYINVNSGFAPLVVQFTDLSENAIEWNWDFDNDGVADSNVQNPTYTYNSPGTYTVSLTVSNINGTDSKTAVISVSAPQSGRFGGPDNFNYTFKDSNIIGGPTYDWIEISGTGTQVLSNTDDAVQDNVDLGFFFNYYGTNYSRLAISSNGLLLNSGANIQCTNEPIGQSPGEHGFIAPFWDDLVNYNGGQVYYQTLGTSPNRIFVTEWVDNQHFGISAQGITFESILYEGSNNIKFQYKDMDFGNGSYDTSFDKGGSATVGIESPDGTDGLQYSFNEQVIDSGKAILFNYSQYSGPSTVIPIASFYSNANSGYAPLSVQFYDNSEYASSWNWNFGDGESSLERNPMHTFYAAGNYTVNLTASNENGTDSKLATITVSEPIIPVANFSTYVTSGVAPLTVQFNDSSENATAWHWDFGDGATSTEMNPEHTYSAAGNYTVTLIVSNWAGSNTSVKHDYVVAYSKPDDIIWGVVPLSLQFTDQSENAISWKWNFGDGTNSTEQNPKHTYTKAGQYAVTVTVNNAAGSNTAIYIGYVNVVNSLEPPVAAFSASPTYGKVPLNVSFNDTSTGSPTSWKWYFGDGTNSTEQNPTHVYSKAGQYAVTLSASNIAGSNSITKLKYISVGNSLKAPITAFSVSVTS